MMYMEIDIYEYSGDHTKLIIGGHNWNSGNSNTTLYNGITLMYRFYELTKPVYFGRRNMVRMKEDVLLLVKQTHHGIMLLFTYLKHDFEF